MRLLELARRGVSLAQRQTHAFKIMLVRRTVHGLGTGLTMQYNSVYAILLGASPVQLGSLQSVGNAVGALVALPAGWSIDYHSPKGTFLLGTALLGVSGLLYFLAPHWAWLYAAIMLYYLGMRITCTSCTVICANELSNEGRATGRGLCRTLSSPVALAAPLLAAWIISRFGGTTVSGIRPIYAVQTVVFVGIFALLLAQLPATRGLPVQRENRQVLSSFVQVFKQGPDVARLLLMMGLMEVPWTISQPFMPVYAHEFKGADEFALGAIAVSMALVPMLASIPLGRLADRYGRKRLLFAIAPLAYAANLCLVFAPASGLGAFAGLMLCGVLFGFNSIAISLASSMAAEVMPREHMGRWIGAVSLFRGLLAIPGPMISGLIWANLGPQYVFFAAIAVDALVRLPLLATTRETLHLERQ